MTNVLSDIKMAGSRLIDGTCFKNFNKMDSYKQRETLLKVMTAAFGAGLIAVAGLGFSGGASLFVATIVAIASFTYLTYDYSPAREFVKNVVDDATQTSRNVAKNLNKLFTN